MESSKVRTERKVVSGTHKLKNKTYRLGDYIERSTKNNHDLRYGFELIEGVTNEGKFSSPKGNVDGVDLVPYKIVDNEDFVYNPSRLDLGSIAYRTEGLCIVSHLYQIFHLNEEGKKKIDPYYLFMYIRRNEFYREVTFRNFGSQRPEFNFNDLSEIYLPLPSLSVQQKYVAVYKAMQKNLAEYENGLEDLKLTCDGFIDKIKNEKSDVKGVKHCRLGELIELFDERNVDGKYTLDDVKGISTDKTFIETKADMNGVSLNSYKIVNHDEFAYVADTSRRGDKIALAYNDSKESLLISSIYTAFRVSHPELLLSDYLSLLFTRSEFDRYARFSSWGSARETFDWNEMCDVKIPLPSIDIQQDIVNIYNVCIERQRIAAELRQKIKTLCPLLIKGSLEEK